MNLHQVLRAVQDWPAADRPSTALATTVRRALRGARVGTPCGGPDSDTRCTADGHGAHRGLGVRGPARHPPGTEETARALVGIELAASVPTGLLGLADFADLHNRQRRVSLVHALTNTAATACLLASHRCRSRGAHTTGKVLTLVGLTALSAGGALGATCPTRRVRASTVGRPPTARSGTPAQPDGNRPQRRVR